jgi:hypothetical protein
MIAEAYGFVPSRSLLVNVDRDVRAGGGFAGDRSAARVAGAVLPASTAAVLCRDWTGLLLYRDGVVTLADQEPFWLPERVRALGLPRRWGPVASL